MAKYKCGHEGGLIVTDCGPLTISALLEWRETVGSEGTREMCWECWCKERENYEATMNEQNNNPRCNTVK